MKHLKSLDLSGNDIGSESIEILASSHSLCKLVKLNVSHTAIGDEGVKYIAYSSFMKNLKQLIAQSINATNFSCIGTSENMNNLVVLDLTKNENITDASIHAILNSSILNKLKRLRIREGNDDRLATLIENSSLFSNLEDWSPQRVQTKSNLFTIAVEYLTGFFK